VKFADTPDSARRRQPCGLAGRLQCRPVWRCCSQRLECPARAGEKVLEK